MDGRTLSKCEQGPPAEIKAEPGGADGCARPVGMCAMSCGAADAAISIMVLDAQLTSHSVGPIGPTAMASTRASSRITVRIHPGNCESHTDQRSSLPGPQNGGAILASEDLGGSPIDTMDLLRRRYLLDHII